METTPATPRVVKEFRFYSESRMVTIVFADDSSDDFTGEENYHKARVAGASHAPASSLELTDQQGTLVAMSIPAETPHETFEA
jgi:hypothetical protein